MAISVLQRAGTEITGETVVGSIQTMITASGWESFNEGPVVYEGEKIVLDPSLMITNYPYAVILDGDPFVAVKHQNGDIGIYGFEQR